MIKHIIPAFIILLNIIPSAALTEKAPTVVSRYYNYIEKLNTNDYDEAIELQTNIMNCFFIDKRDKEAGFSGVDVVDWITNEYGIASNVFAQRLTNYIHIQKRLRLDSYNIFESEVYSQPARGKSDQDLILTASVELVMTHKGVSLPVKRREKLFISDNRIFKIEAPGSASSDEDNTDQDVGAEDDIAWTIKAAEYYTRKQHKEAYEAYRRAIEINPHNINALYRLGVMTIQGKGVKKSIHDAKIYFEEVLAADTKRNYTIWNIWNLRKQAANAIYLIEHPQAM